MRFGGRGWYYFSRYKTWEFVSFPSVIAVCGIWIPLCTVNKYNCLFSPVSYAASPVSAAAALALAPLNSVQFKFVMFFLCRMYLVQSCIY